MVWQRDGSNLGERQKTALGTPTREEKHCQADTTDTLPPVHADIVEDGIVQRPVVEMLLGEVGCGGHGV